MKKITLGKTGIEVSYLGFGTGTTDYAVNRTKQSMLEEKELADKFIDLVRPDHETAGRIPGEECKTSHERGCSSCSIIHSYQFSWSRCAKIHH